jgi:hypothetical protein
MAEAKRTMPVHALGDERVHLAQPHHGRLAQGRLKTLCGLQAVSEVPLFSAVDGKRCRICYSRVDEYGYVTTTAASPTTKPSRSQRPGK